MLDTATVGFIGGGNMGEALIRGILQAGLLAPERLVVFDVSRERLEHLEGAYGVVRAETLSACAQASQVIIVAVKPQNMGEVLESMAPSTPHRPLVISIAAGVPIQTIEAALPQGIPVIRVMPNTPALVQQGASALARGTHAEDTHMEAALTLFRSVGIAHELDEKLLDAVTGLSGSGPAYVLHFLESLTDGGVLMGIPRPVARDLVVQTVMGTARMILETGRHPSQLKDMVTSPGGTTIHGLEVLEKEGVRGAIMGAVRAATERSKALGG
ncbi:pyrroline-5-carboxylate reductase [Desulfacinum hydrothermale DSM 13146]|uniref:Pyrroline-5-carboxylate reductase n=1 Tax=Desulfacinum hydrothermale DSM 13146 TaxID=1121390 RepID=A0A1W1XMQ7_9BACT|nr:pyrroline-5-carboxylate reductase [Desulfacinum hydrothermale]SMC25269.1 pyrroline-5-carboxylate reductase [Desulfacinum hydrothermale DSM 13146]